MPRKKKETEEHVFGASIVEQMERFHSDDPDERALAMNEIVNEHMGLVSMVIERYFKNFKHDYYEDMLSCGKLGLITAIEKYNPSASKPATFFTFYIKHEIYDYVVRFVQETTPYFVNELRLINKAIEEIEERTGEDATPIDIAYNTGLSVKAVTRAFERKMYGQKKTYESDDYLDSILNEFDESPEDALIRREREGAVYKMVESLNPIEAEVVIRKYGLYDTSPRTNAQIAREISEEYQTKISPSEIRSILNAAFRNLKKNKTATSMFADNLKAARKKIKDKNIAMIPSKESDEQMEEIEKEFASSDDVPVGGTGS